MQFIWVVDPKTKHASATLTFALWSVIVILLRTVVSGLEIVGPASYSLKFSAMDAGLVAAILTPTLTAYASRKYMDSNKPAPDIKSE